VNPGILTPPGREDFFLRRVYLSWQRILRRVIPCIEAEYSRDILGAGRV
jgi:hypothetical protein